MRHVLPILLLTAAGLLSACTTPLDAPQADTFGVALATMQAQARPAPVNPAPPASSGAAAAGALVRLQTDRVKTPTPPATSGGVGATQGY
jgi:hypothetical protein